VSMKKARRAAVGKKSVPHLAIRQLIKNAFPGFRLFEEHPIQVPGRAYNTTLFIDFVLPDFRVAVEVHGEQHDKFIPHFHGSPEGFQASKTRDAAKASAIAGIGHGLIVIRQADIASLNHSKFMALFNKAVEEIAS